MPPARSKLLISSNERPKMFIEMMVRELGEDRVEVCHLDEGDYVWRDVVVERKKVDNLVSSIVKRKTSGKRELWDQLERCKESGRTVVLLVEGTLIATSDAKECIADGKHRRVPYLAVQSSIVAAQRKGVIVVHTDGMRETIKFLSWVMQGNLKRG